MWGGRSKQIGQGKLMGGDPGGQRYHGLAAWLHHWDSTCCPGPECGLGARAEKPSPARPRFPYYRELADFCSMPPYTDNPSSRVASRWQCASRWLLSSMHLKKARPLHFMSSLTVAVPSHWWHLGVLAAGHSAPKGAPQ